MCVTSLGAAFVWLIHNCRLNSWITSNQNLESKFQKTKLQIESGDIFDIHGKDGGIYNLLSAAKVCINAMIAVLFFNVFDLKVPHSML